MRISFTESQVLDLAKALRRSGESELEGVLDKAVGMPEGPFDYETRDIDNSFTRLYAEGQRVRKVRVDSLAGKVYLARMELGQY